MMFSKLPYKLDASDISHAVILGLRSFCTFKQRWYYHRYHVLTAKGKHGFDFKFTLITCHVHQKSKLRPYQLWRKLSFAMDKGFRPREGTFILFLGESCKPTRGSLSALKQLKGVLAVRGGDAARKALQLLYSYVSARMRCLRQVCLEKGLDVRDAKLGAAQLYLALTSLARELERKLGPPT
ncbi:MAG: hypothetical protein DRO09_00095 [Thermoprotei archaeon]|nr:MAG: hypothetical protein DRO09_00095 [Thermoprotei archaeon]